MCPRVRACVQPNTRPFMHVFVHAVNLYRWSLRPRCMQVLRIHLLTVRIHAPWVGAGRSESLENDADKRVGTSTLAPPDGH